MALPRYMLWLLSATMRTAAAKPWMKASSYRRGRSHKYMSASRPKDGNRSALPGAKATRYSAMATAWSMATRPSTIMTLVTQKNAASLDGRPC
ncbi:hypothetical protein CDD83_8726 [Cordyceps sp. RAO-2017]|nr:hypothetical protein CDD83_8726 [Cordyceps sp. RAO-2017]